MNKYRLLTARIILAVYFSINLLKSTDYVMQQQVKYSTTVRTAHTVFTCFVFSSEQAGICATYSIN